MFRPAHDKLKVHYQTGALVPTTVVAANVKADVSLVRTYVLEE